MNPGILIFALLAGQAEECPVELVMAGPGVPHRVQVYADCMSRPYLPVTATDLAKKKLRCAIAPLRSTAQAVAWVDQMAANFPGCEMRLGFKRK